MKDIETNREKILVTSALPYANGPIHFGHIAGAYLPADIFVRFKKMTGADIIYICGSDDHGVAITISAEAAGRTPEEHVKINHNLIEGIFSRMNIGFSNFSGTSRKIHYPISQEFFTRLLEKGLIEEKVTEQYYCEKCARFMADRYIVGTCPSCGYEEAWGNECGSCGIMLETNELINPRCKICNGKPELRETNNWFLKLGDMADWLEGWMKDNADGAGGKIPWKKIVTTEVQGYLKRGLQSRAITRDLDWGIPVPLDNAKGKVLYVWFDAPIGYISSTKEFFESRGEPDRWKDYWQNPDCKLYHFIGKDNIPFHAIIFPIMLKAMDQGYKLPDFVASNAFLNLEGRQFSKSAGWYIDVLDFLENYPADSIRYYLCSDMPENTDSEFRWDRYQTAHNSELTNIYANLVNRTLKFISTKMDGKVPAAGEQSDIDMALAADIESAAGNVAGFLDRFEFRNAIGAMMDLARAGNKYFDECAPWKSLNENPAEADKAIRNCLRLIKTLSVVSYPFLPDTAQKVWNMLGMDGNISDVRWEDAPVDTFEVGTNLPEPEILFNKIDNKQVAAEKKKLSAAKPSKQKKKAEPSIPGIKKSISFDDFSKLDLRVGKILEAEPVQGSFKMLKLSVDVGVEKRQIIAGIAQHYKPEEIVGLSVVVVSNLEPKKLMGLESMGMLLAGSDKDSVRLVTLDKDMAPGIRIS
ncbi:MAG TPA: methionine--tRNA ligase [bacterium]|nr:methionine--tRNA ligase [bacterium]